jgi:O-acetyl-ADP-ribose deacetylase (regulator of RNase III)
MMRLEVLKGDITAVDVDAVVNAANTSLLGGGGVDGAIHRKGGKAILEACIQIRNRQGGCETGKAVITTAGNLPARYVIHTVGPVWRDGKHNEAALLRSCYTESLKLARLHDVKSIAFPNISTGIYHFPKDKAAEIAIEAVKDFEEAASFEKIIFVCFDEENYELYVKAVGRMSERNYIRDVLFGVAVGDAIGVPVEFLSRGELKQKPVTGMMGYGTHNQPPEPGRMIVP